jgi:hypothetical protein
VAGGQKLSGGEGERANLGVPSLMHNTEVPFRLNVPSASMLPSGCTSTLNLNSLYAWCLSSGV